jgi:hypothetical protein
MEKVQETKANLRSLPVMSGIAVASRNHIDKGESAANTSSSILRDRTGFLNQKLSYV